MHDYEPIVSVLCCHMENPICVEKDRVIFEWKCRAPQAGHYQKSYQILVADTLENIEKGNGSIWDSRKVYTRKSAGIPYGGPELSEGKKYYWKVIVQDENGALFTSEAGYFMTGISCWQGKWLGGANYKAAENAPFFRKEFAISFTIASAYLYIAAVGYYEVRLNGEKVGNHVLDPGWTDKNKSVLYNVYEVTDLLKKGNNAIGVIMGTGWYSNGPYSYESEHQGGHFLLQMEILSEEGERYIVKSDLHDGWLVTSETPIKSNSIYHGEVYDARDELPGWDLPDYQVRPENKWEEPLYFEPPTGILKPQVMEPIRVRGLVDAVGVQKTSENEYVLDFGQNMSGWVRFQVRGNTGDHIKLKFSESVNDDGFLDVTTTRDARSEDEYILKGGGEESYEPRFTYHGFRYVRVTGYPGEFKKEYFKACFVCSDVKRRSEFECGNDMVNRIHRAILWTELSNLHSIPTDCPQRDERLGWLNDMTVRAEEAVYNFDMAAFYKKWVEDILEAQGKVTGAITDVAPFFKYGRRPADPVCSSFLIVPWLIYLHYGDRSLLEKGYEGMKRWEDYLEISADDDIVKFSYFGDWCGPIIVSDPTSQASGSYSAITPAEYISTWAYYLNSVLLQKFAQVLDKPEDYTKYTAMRERILRKFNKKFLNEDTCQYAKGSQASNLAALLLKMVPEGKEQRVLANLIDDVVDKSNTHMTTGNQCTKYILDVLSLYGYIDVAFKLVSQTSYPSWGYMIEHGATTIWERWEEADANCICCSQSHPMNASLGSWFYKYLAGIAPDEEAPGFENVIIRPYIPENLSFARAVVDTVKGEISSFWKKEEGQLNLEIEIPFNCTASIILETRKFGYIQLNGKNVWKRDCALQTDTEMDRELVKINVLSGSYQLTCYY